MLKTHPLALQGSENPVKGKKGRGAAAKHLSLFKACNVATDIPLRPPEWSSFHLAHLEAVQARTSTQERLEPGWGEFGKGVLLTSSVLLR